VTRVSVRFSEIFKAIQFASQYSSETGYATYTRKERYITLCFFCSFLLLPLFWGLAFFLKTDANILVVLFTMVWSYNWIKYALLPPKVLSEEK
jgi:hypothetical protein